MAKKRTTKSTTYPEGKVQSLSGSKRISEKKYNRKLKKAKEGEVTQNQQDKHGFFGEKESFSVRNTNVNKKNKVFIKRETPDSDYNNTSYLKVKTKPTRKEKKSTKYQREQDVENAALSGGASMKKFPEIKKKNEGKFTAWVEKNMGGMDTCKAASKVMRSRTKKYSPAVVKMANYANNFGCKTKKEDGASVPLKGNQKNLPEALRKKILASDGASLSSKRADKKIAKGQMHKKMSVAQKQEALKNKTARFNTKLGGTPEEEGVSMKKPRGTKEEMAQRKVDKRNDRVRKRTDRSISKLNKGADKIIAKKKAGKITEDLAREKIMKAYDNKKYDKARFRLKHGQ